MRILLTYKAHASGARDPYTSLLPIGLGIITALLQKEGYRSRLANFSNSSWKDCASFLAAEQPDIMGISQFTHNRFDSLRLAKLAKEANPACFVVVGGPHATHRYHEILSGNRVVDAVVLGEGEETVRDLAKTLETGGSAGLEAVRGIAFRRGTSIIKTPPRPPVADLDALPIPAAGFAGAQGVDLHRQLEFIITSRGCPAACRFCASPRFWGKALRFRSPGSMVDEIRYIRDRHGLIYFSFRDDTFTADKKRVIEFCRLLLEEKLSIIWNCQSRVSSVDEEMLSWMKRAGCECVQFGIESGSPRVLKELGKNITLEQTRRASRATRRAGIHLSVYLITGVPGESEADLEASLRLIDEIRPHDGQVSPLAYYPGTLIFNEGVTSGAVDGNLFESVRREGLYARDDPFVERSKEMLLARLHKVAADSRFGRGDFIAQKKFLGYCHTTNIMAGGAYEELGRFDLAEEEYREILQHEPENPWGWLALGELCGKWGKLDGAQDAFLRLAEIVPAHAPAYSALGEICRLSGDHVRARSWYRQALHLNPFDETATSGLRIIEGRKK